MSKKQRDKKRMDAVSRSEQLKRKKRGRIIVISAIALIVIVAIGLAGFSYYNSRVKPYNEAAISVNGVTHDMGYYIKMLDLHYGNVSTTVLSDYTSYGEQEIEQFAGYVEQQIVQNEKIRQGSAALGFTVDKKAIKDEIKKTDQKVTDESVNLLTAQRLIEQQVPSTQPQAHVQAIFVESERVAREAKARLEAGESWEEVAQSLSKISAAQIADGDLGWVTAREADLTLGSTIFGDTIFGSEVNVISGPVYDDAVTKIFGFWVIKVADKEEATDNTTARVNIQGILTGTEEEAYDIIDKLNGGEDIDELAKEISQFYNAAENGSDMGWIDQGWLTSDYDQLFDLPINGVSSPISDNQSQTTGGYWIYNVLEKEENRELTTEQQNLLINDFIERCTAELEKNPDYSVDILMTDEMRVFAINEAVLAQGEGSVLIRTGSLTNAVAGEEYYLQLEAYGNQKGNKWSITEGNLADGMSFDGDKGIISGTPKLAGGYSVTFEVNSGIHHWTQEFFLRVRVPLEIRTESLPDARVGEFYSETIELWGDANAYSWSVVSGNLTEGLTLGISTGSIYGTPTTAGTIDFTLKVDCDYGTVTKDYSLTIAEAEPSEE